MEIFICKYCGRRCKNKNSLRNHERLCRLNPNRQIPVDNFKAYRERCKKEPAVRLYKNQFDKARKLGLPVPEVSAETKERLRKAKIGSKLDKDARDRKSATMRVVVQKHPESYSAANVNGRVKKIKYGTATLDGRWELEVAKFFDRRKIKWEKNLKSFPYIWNGKVHSYFPDFYLPEFNRYVEVKGYERDRDRCKYTSVPGLIVLKLQEIKQIKDGRFELVL